MAKREVHQIVDYRCPSCGRMLNTANLSAEKIEIIKLQYEIEKERLQIKAREEKENREWKQKVIKVVAIAGAIIAFYTTIYFVTRDYKSDSQILKETVDKVYASIESEDYDSALLEANKIRKKKEGLIDRDFNYWETQRNELIKIIEQKKKEQNK